ncbi:PilZ domain-containing protein [Tepidicaulis sp. LMO-SS28]|uniref:PilZ domain-containing protein n=1 Tax=Tepidicaulis sp. LMO-SS28 TaxID=3447455 RepID=UPI003EE00F9D
MQNLVSTLLERGKKTASRSITAEENRRYHRASFPRLEVEARGFIMRARDWSAGGALIGAEGLDLSVGSIITGQTGWITSTLRYPYYADVVRRVEDGKFALRWLKLDPAFLRELDEAAHAGEPLAR